MAGAGSDPPPPRLLSIPKEGERVIAPTRRPDGTLRKPIRIRAGYVPQDEVAIYQSKGALLMKESQPQVSPGYDPALAEKPKTKSSKRNERKKEKRHQPALEKERNLELEQSDVKKAEDVASTDNMAQREEPMEAVIEQMCRISVSTASEVVTGSTDTVEIPKPESSGMDLDEKIRALKKKIRLAEVQLQDKQQNLTSEQLEKMRKVEGWREELTLLEDQKVCSRQSPKPQRLGRCSLPLTGSLPGH